MKHEELLSFSSQSTKESKLLFEILNSRNHKKALVLP